MFFQLHHLLTAVLFLTAVKSTTSTRECPPCGTTRVPYPLSTSPTCGDPNYKILCNKNTTLLFPTSNNTYPIKSIIPTNQRLIIEPSPFLPNTCITSDISTQGVQLNQTAPFNVTGDNTIMFLNCSDSLLRSPLNCSADSLCHVYINSTRAVSSCGGSLICCTFRAGGGTTSYSIRVREAGCRAYSSFVDLDPSLPVGKWGKPGLMIQWVLPQEPLCRTQADCTVDGGNSTCRADINSVGVRRCFCNDGLHWDGINGICAEKNLCEDEGGCKSSNKAALIAGLVSGIAGALIFATIAILYYQRQRKIKEAIERLKKEREDILNSGGGTTAKIFTGKEIKKTTNNFSRDRLLGAGGYGEVYKGKLDDGTLTAVKCAKVGNAKGTDQILNEVRILCQVNHRSLVGLLGCCVELDQPIMVYEFIPNGTLYEHLHGFTRGGYSRLSWSHRLSIAYDTAEALAYLHFSANPPIYHRDVKSSNILLDEKLHAKVADFGLSRLAETDMSHISTCAQGTLGYLDPEYYRNYQLTDKSDVYSFGVVLLELLTSQKAIDLNREADDVNLAVYVKRLVEEERMMDVVDPLLKEEASDLEMDTMKALGFLAVGCLEERRQNRPSMKEVSEEIEYIISIASAMKLAKVIPDYP
ncbi:wall-associated receptor kinase-like 20 [Amaranthus tricolor]|uniref:wall-associated receptor kinase-like 20 n=1 Tax=Amaranthus tricolor TaxID=29722 RepID=UPI00258D1331|nr:wall-associated receptor kinase-like 20 [Amaranthus tricolor]